MVLLGELAVRAFDVLVCGVAADAQQLVVVEAGESGCTTKQHVLSRKRLILFVVDVLVEVPEHVVHGLLLGLQPPIRRFELQLALNPINDPALNLVESLVLQVVEVDVQLTALHELHYDVAQSNVEVRAQDCHLGELLTADLLRKVP